MPRNREEADLFFCSVTPLQNVRNENREDARIINVLMSRLSELLLIVRAEDSDSRSDIEDNKSRPIIQ